MKKIGIMGGTFDPIHYGHLVAAEGARSCFDLDRVIFVPAAMPPHKEVRVITDSNHRYKMTALAIDSNQHFHLSDVEIKRQGPSYTYETVRYFKEAFPDTEIYFITGADAVLEILTWHRVQDLLDICCFIAATRPGFRLENLADILRELPDGYINKISLMEVPALSISSTDIRARVKKGLTIKYLLPEDVEEYIHSKGLYRD